MNHKLWLMLFYVSFILSTGGAKDVFARENKWTVLKKGVFKNSLNILVVDPSKPDVLYASVADTGVLKSVDCGKSWELKNNGLRNRTIQKIVIDPFHPNRVYACTKGGLYRSVNGGEQWEPIGFTPDTAVNAIAMLPQNLDTIYVAINADLYRSRNGGKSWQLFPDSIHATIRAIAVSPVNPSQLYIGTDAGIYKILDSEDTIKVLHGPDEWEQKTIDFAVDPFHTKVIFALRDTSGIYWALDGEWRWRQMNKGFEKHRTFPLSSLSINPNRPRTLYATNRNGDIFTYEFAFPQIGILDFSSTALPSWEIAAISQHIANALSKTYSVKWLSRNELNAIDSSLTFLENQETVVLIGRRFGFELVISGEILIDFQEQLRIIPKIAFIGKDSLVVVDYDKSIIVPRYNYLPQAMDKVVEWIYKHINFEPFQLSRPQLSKPILGRGFRKDLWFVAILSFGLGYTIHSLVK